MWRNVAIPSRIALVKVVFPEPVEPAVEDVLFRSDSGADDIGMRQSGQPIGEVLPPRKRFSGSALPVRIPDWQY